MKSGNYDISVDQGSTFVFHLTYQDSAGTAIDLSSYSASMQVRRSTIDTDLLLDISNSGGVTGGGSTGEYTAGVSAASGGGSWGHIYSGITMNGSTVGWGGASGTTGGIYILIDADTMKNVPAGKHVYDLELTTGTDVNKILKGRFEVEGEVTR
jgi:hypothetical protein|tara:strand:+ start:355 stop:816 length:462 start_codon:yes stop_codon:yes gene_type:complete